MEAKNILIIQGGGRPNGNTAQLIGSFTRGVEEAGHAVEVIFAELCSRKAVTDRFSA